MHYHIKPRYISTEDNSENHGPGSQQMANPHEADACFGKIMSGFDTDVERIKKVPGHEFINDEKKWVLIKRMRILVPAESEGGSEGGGYIEWRPSKAVA